MGRLQKYDRVVLGSGGVLFFLALWELIPFVSYDLKSAATPLSVIAALPDVATQKVFVEAVKVSSYQFAVGSLIGLPLAVVLAIVFGLYQRLGTFFDLFMTAGYAIPMIALVPVFVLLLGIGDLTAITIVASFAFFPAYFVVHGTITSIDRKLVRMCRSFGGADRDVVFGIIIPSIVPAIVSGARLGLGRALIGLVVTELYLGVGGLGSYIMTSSTHGDQNAALIAISVIAGINLMLTEAIRAVEKRVEVWRPEAS